MPDLNALSTLTTTATALSNLILVTPQTITGYQPILIQTVNQDNQITTTQPPGLLFNYEGEQTTSIESDITDHFVENNIAIQDQISLKPEIITTHGFIGELNDLAPYPLQIVQTLANKLTTVGNYVPQLSTTALIAYNEAFQAYQVAQATISGVSSWATLNQTQGQNVIGSAGLQAPVNTSVTTTQTKQQIAFQQFYSYWRTRTFFTVQTPWAVFQNMVIQKLRAIQDDTTRTITDFEVTFKMIRFATTVNIATPKLRQTRNATQSSKEKNLGTSQVIPSINLDTGLSRLAPAAIPN